MTKPNSNFAKNHIITFLCLLMFGASTALARSEDVWVARHRLAVATLRGALKDAKQWKKVHAGEALLWNGYPQGVRETFEAELRNADPDYCIAVWRVLARAQGADKAARRIYVNKIYHQFLHTRGEALIGILETLGKLGFSKRTHKILWLARHGDARTQVMARWVLANSGQERDEAFLAELLNAKDSHVRGFAAYALRFFNSIQPATLRKLQSQAAQESSGSGAWVYLWSTLFVHAPKVHLSVAKATLLKMANGTDAEKYEVGMGLARRGARADILAVENLLKDKEIDVRISAAHALLSIERRVILPAPIDSGKTTAR